MLPCTLKTTPDGLEVETPGMRLVLATSLFTFAVVIGIFLVGPSGWKSWSASLLIAATVPVSAVVGYRFARGRRVRLWRQGERLFCEGEELEVARVETRMMLTPLVRVPSAYRLSIWGLTVEGRAVEILLGERRDLLSASRIAGALEDFIGEVAPADGGTRPVRLR